MIKAIFFDAFGTLFKVVPSASAKEIIGHIKALGYDIDKQGFISEWKAYYKQHTAEGAEFKTERDIFISRIIMFYDRYGICRSAENDADALLQAAHKREVYAEVPSVLQQLGSKYKIFIASNTDNDVLDSVMHHNSITVDRVYTSENLRCYKPAQAFFNAILADNQLTAQEAIFVGDSIVDDVYGAQGVGIRAFLLDRRGLSAHEHAITDLRELVDIVAALD